MEGKRKKQVSWFIIIIFEWRESLSFVNLSFTYSDSFSWFIPPAAAQVRKAGNTRRREEDNKHTQQLLLMMMKDQWYSN